MNPNYTLRILTILTSHKVKRNITLKFERYIDFIPVEGMRLRFTDDNGETMDVTLINLYYDYTDRVWVEEQEDTYLADELRESDGPECTVTKEALDEYIDYYKSFGWERTANG